MGVFNQITETIGQLLSEKLLAGLRILSGSKDRSGENRSEPPASAVAPDDEQPNTAPMEENAKMRLSSNRLGWHGNRG
jgi:hypothetical protein